MAEIVLVHGIDQQQKSADKLESAWLPALAGGVRVAGFPEVADRIWRGAGKPGSIETRMAFYGSLFRTPGQMGDDPGEFTPEETEFAEAFAKEWLEHVAARATKQKTRETGCHELYHYAKGDTPAEACRKSGAHPNAFDLYLRSEPAGPELRAVMKNVIEREYAPAAFRFLNEVVHDPAMPPRVRVDSAKIICDRADFVAAPPAPQLYEKELEHMSIAELESHIRTLEAGMKDVTPAATDGDSADDAPAG
jgi:hypothetical protein